MAKLNKRFKFIKEVSKETYYANIYSSLDDMEDNQPVLKADIVLDESTTIPGYIQGSRSRYDDDLLDVYVAPTNGQADFRLKSRSVKRIATGVSIFSTPGNHTFNVPIGVTRVLALTVAGGSNFDYIHKPRPTNWSELEKDLQFTSVPSKVSVTGREDVLLESGVDKQTASYAGSQITGYSIDASQVPLQNMKSLSILRCISVHHLVFTMTLHQPISILHLVNYVLKLLM